MGAVYYKSDPNSGLMIPMTKEEAFPEQMYVGSHEEVRMSCLDYMYDQSVANPNFYMRTINEVLCGLEFAGWKRRQDSTKFAAHWDIWIGEERLSTRYSFNSAHNFLEQHSWMTEPENQYDDVSGISEE